MKVVEKQLKELRMYENNPRNNDQAVEEVAKSIKEFGFKVPMVIDTNNVIVCGHTRYKACLELGIETVPCVVADDLTEDQIKAFRLVENKTNELATWDANKLNEELEKLDQIDFGSLFSDIEEGYKNNEWFESHERFDDGREEGNDEYNEFLDKFVQPKTTDDCYTPDNVYEVVADYVAKRFKTNKKYFVRPFYPNGDYTKENYSKVSVVVDNPPFSILAEIIDFYLSNNIKFFLFAPCVTVFNYLNRDNITVMPLMSQVVYENGAIVSTAFITNLFNDGTVVDNDPNFRIQLEEANSANLEALHKQLPKYEYPASVLTGAKLGWLSKYGQRIVIKKGSCILISALDEQKAEQKAIYGKGLLLSERLAQERLAQERLAQERLAQERLAQERLAQERLAQEKAKAKVYELSEREKELQRGLV